MLYDVYRAVLVWALLAGCAQAATVSVVATDQQGRPAPDAVVTLVPTDKVDISSRVPARAIIAQQNEMFLPLVVIVRRGGSVVFTNNDTTKHQVYSFASIKQFAFEIDRGQVSQPVVFPLAGVAAIGCNIHDQMIAYVDVTDEPFAAITNAQGRAELKDVPAGGYRAVLWHPRLPPGRPQPSLSVKVDGDATQIAISASLLPERPMNMRMEY